ncbi:MAG TPA: hypothetical protein PKM65_20550 [Spirochaetota bacterium]|nr:hypothetical protein [Spirochaetota bacterium]
MSMSFREVWQDFVQYMPGITFENHASCVGFVDIARLWNFRAFTEPEKCEDIMQLEGEVFVSVPNPKRAAASAKRKKSGVVDDDGSTVDDMRD